MLLGAVPSPRFLISLPINIVFWTWLCILPKTTLLVVGADAFTVGIAEGEIPWRLVGILAIILIVLVFLVRHARKTLDEKEQRP